MEFARFALNGARGLGVDLDANKVQQTIKAGYDAVVADVVTLSVSGKVRFVLMSHFLEHLPGVGYARDCIATAVRCARDFVLIQQPYFDADGFLFDQALKLTWSDWTGHPTHITSLQLYSMLAAFQARSEIARFLVGRRMRISDSSDPAVLPLQSVPDQPCWDRTKHSIKPTTTFDFPVFRETFALILLRPDCFDESLQLYARKREGEIVFDSAQQLGRHNGGLRSGLGRRSRTR